MLLFVTPIVQAALAEYTYSSLAFKAISG